MKQIVPSRSPVLDNMKRQGVLEGIEKGREEGIIYVLTELANDPDNDYDIEELAHKFGYGVEEITDEK